MEKEIAFLSCRALTTRERHKLKGAERAERLMERREKAGGEGSCGEGGMLGRRGGGQERVVQREGGGKRVRGKGTREWVVKGRKGGRGELRRGGEGLRAFTPVENRQKECWGKPEGSAGD